MKPLRLTLLVVPDVQYFLSERLLPSIQLDALDVTQNLVHDPGASVFGFHELALHPLLIASNQGVKRHCDNHDANADKSLPADEVVERDESQDDLQGSTPRNVPILTQVGNTDGIDRLQVNNVTGRSAVALSVAENEGFAVDEGDQTASHSHS